MSAARRLTTPPAVLTGLAALSAAVLLAWESHLTFFFDDWDLLIHRPGVTTHTLLEPHNEHIILAPTLVYKAIQSTFGMDSVLPFATASTATFLASVVLLFAYLRRRVGGWLAVAAVTPILFMGTAYEDLLTPFQIGFFGAMAFGLGALLALERGDRLGDAIACALLVFSLTFAEIGLSFLLGVTLAIGLDRGPLRRVYVVAVPALLYAAWYAGWGHHAENTLSFHSFANSPAFVLDGLAATVGSLLGFERPALFGGSGGLAWGRPVLLALVVLGVWRSRGLPPAPKWLWVSLSLVLTFWFLTALNTNVFRPPTAPRYQYVSAVFLLMVAAELAAGWRPGWRGVTTGFAIAIVATLGNGLQLHQTYEGLRRLTPIIRGALAGLEVAADRVPPGFVLTSQNSGFDFLGAVDAGPYLTAVHRYGSPAYPVAQLDSAPEPTRVAADRVVTAALGLTFQPLAEPPAAGSTAPRLLGPPGAVVGSSPGCLTVKRSDGALPVLTLPPGGVTLSASPGVQAGLSLRRYATESFPILVGTLHRAARLDIPRDRSNQPWELQLDPTGPVTVCGP